MKIKVTQTDFKIAKKNLDISHPYPKHGHVIQWKSNVTSEMNTQLGFHIFFSLPSIKEKL